jgi:4-diphosphocytidyl-2-C-methyl-D-erythritol kinase
VPGPWVGVGAGHRLLAAPELPPYAVVVMPQPFPLSTADVYREADRLGELRPGAEMEIVRHQLSSGFSAELIVNDLQAAALSLAPAIAQALQDALAAGADDAIVCGSGPTVVALFWGEDAASRARETASVLQAGHPAALAADPVRGGDGPPATN